MESTPAFPATGLQEMAIKSCSEIQKDEYGIDVLLLVIDDWSTLLDESTIADLSRKCSQVKIRFDRIVFPSETLGVWLFRQLGFKIVSIEIRECHDIGWKSHIKPLLHATQSLTSLVLIKNRWVNDTVVEEIAKKYSKILQYVKIEDCRITDNAIFTLAHKCPNLKQFELICCPKVTSAGLKELSKKVHLVDLHLAHNMNITDECVEAMLASGGNLNTLRLIHCPRLTDRTIKGLYEHAVSWGTKRSTKAQDLKLLEVRDNDNVTDQMLFYIAAAAQGIVSLDLRDCPSLDVCGGLSQIEQLVHLENLKIGCNAGNPFNPKISFDSDSFIESLLFHMANLKVLHMIEIPHISDTDLAELFAASVVLEEVVCEGVEVGTHAVEALCVNSPQVLVVRIARSEVLDDGDVRCLCNYCLELTSLEIQHCVHLGDGAFTRINTLRKLTHLDISKASSTMCDGTFLTSISYSPLKSLVLDSLPSLKLAASLSRIQDPQVLRNLHKLSVRHCALLSASDVSYLLSNLVRCIEIDLTGCTQVYDKLAFIFNPSPFLVYSGSLDEQQGSRSSRRSARPYDDFVGYVVTSAMRMQHKHYEGNRVGFRKMQAAAMIQRHFRKHLAKVKVKRLEKREECEDWARGCVIKIQSVMRMKLVGIRARPKFRAAMVLTRAARQFLYKLYLRKCKVARSHYLRQLKSKCFQKAQAFSHESRSRLAGNLQKASVRLAFREKRKVLLTFKRMFNEAQRNFMENQLCVLWQFHLLVRMIAHWKKIIGSGASRLKRLARILIIAVPMEKHNSYRQQANLVAANSFARRKVMLPPWARLLEDYIRAKKAEKLLPMAISWGAKQFYKRLMVPCFWSFNKHKNDRIFKKAAVARGILYNLIRLKRLGTSHMRTNEKRCKRERSSVQKGVKFSKTYHIALAVRIYWQDYTRIRLYDKFTMPMWTEHWRKKSIRRGFTMIIKDGIRHKDWRKLCYKADVYARKRMTTSTYRMWKEHVELMKQKDEMCRMIYLKKVKTISLGAFKAVLEEKRAYLRSIEDGIQARIRAAMEREAGGLDEDEEEEEEEEDDMDDLDVDSDEEEEDDYGGRSTAAATKPKKAPKPKKKSPMKLVEGMDLNAVIRAVTKLQARFRAGRCRQYYRDFRAEALFATMTLQKFARRGLANRKYRRLKRYDIIDRIRVQQAELENMREEDADSFYYEYLIRSIVKIQTNYRGYIARVLSATMARDQHREYSQQHYINLELYKKRLDTMRKAREAKERYKGQCALKIQAVVRGRIIAMRLYEEAKIEYSKAGKAVIIQRSYRRRMAELRLMALRRHVHEQLRAKEAHHHRGFIMRKVGFNGRFRHQLISFLNFTGFDPMTFVTRTDQLIAETYHDFHEAKNVFLRECSLWRKYYRNSYERTAERRKIIEAGKWSTSLFDSVRITEEGHQFYGYTGIVVRIDSEIAGVPLFEIRLDHINRQTYVQMSTDAVVAYNNPCAHVTRISSKPTLQGFAQPYKIFGVEEKSGGWFKKKKEGRPVASRREIYAAWTIQRAFRMHRAKRLTARRRFEMWSRSADRHWLLVQQLADTNALTQQGMQVSRLLSVRPNKEVHFDEIKHPIVARKFNVALRSDEKAVVKNEYKILASQRLSYATRRDKKELRFRVGAEELTAIRKSMILFRMGCGYLFRGRQRVGDVSGVRGVRMMSRKAGLVTGLSRYDFKDFHKSPHLRYDRAFLYQGEWSGVPCFTPLVPHGEGILVFLDAWGFSKEDKTMFLTIVGARDLHFVNPRDMNPYCDVHCQKTTVHTSVCKDTRDPVFNETLQIDVTNPKAEVTIVVRGKHKFGGSEWIGQVILTVGDYASGEPVEETHQLKTKNYYSKKDYALGEIDTTVKWVDRVFDDDFMVAETKSMAAVRVQSAMRMYLGKKRLDENRIDRDKSMVHMRKCAVLITCICRIRLAKKEASYLRLERRAAIKIQKRIRIFHAVRTVTKKRMERFKAIVLQKYARRRLAVRDLAKRRADRHELLRSSSTAIQSRARRWQAITRVRLLRMKRDAEQKQKVLSKQVDDGTGEATAAEEEEEPESVAEWMQWYGRDPDYGSKRLRRVAERVFAKTVKRKFMRIAARRFGIVFAKEYPYMPPFAADDAEAKETCDAKDYVVALLPAFNPGSHNAKQRQKMLKDGPERFGIFHIPTEIDVLQTVGLSAIMIQCMLRQRFARNRLGDIVALHKSIAKFQRMWREKQDRQHKAARTIQSIFYVIVAKTLRRILLHERKATMTIQCAWRQYKARCELFDARTIDDISVLKHTPSIPFYGPDRVLDRRDDTFWLAETTHAADIRFEFSKRDLVDAIWILANTFEASPTFVSVYTVRNKEEREFDMIVRKTFMPNLKGLRWHKLPLNPPVFSKYFKVAFEENYGDPQHLGVKQIRFQRQKEFSPVIKKEPQDVILNSGPCLGNEQVVTLSVMADSWPLPSYQWYCNNKIIRGATSATLKVALYCATDKNTRYYRCKRCRMVSSTVPVNAYNVQCINCKKDFDYPEIVPYMEMLDLMHELEEKAIHDREKLKDLLYDAENMKDSDNHDDAVSGLKRRIQEAEDCLVGLRESRIFDKSTVAVKNSFKNEGIYRCIVKNYRGGSLRMTRKSRRVVVAVETPSRYVLDDVEPEYIPRLPRIRRRWPLYSSLVGFFNKGKLEGNCVIQYQDGAFYEGPYVQEDGVDDYGCTLPGARVSNHYGVFTTRDKRIFEGVNVDNHFDIHNLQHFYKVTFPNKDVYEGFFVDEEFHGTGVYRDRPGPGGDPGDVYEGNWHRGKRFGQGLLRSVEGWTYEGYFDANRRHRHGIVTWPDGSWYAGDWHFEKRTGKGMYLSRLRDLYKGEFLNNQYRGWGELVYAGGGRYLGEFRDDLRHGKGHFIDKAGNEYYGDFVHDKQHGEHIVKAIVNIEVEGQDNYEIRVGLFDSGNLVKWTVVFSHPVVTKKFIDMFRGNDMAFDSVYALMLAKNLPNLPPGVDAKNPFVQKIAKRLRDEAGGLLSNVAVLAAQAKLAEMLEPVRSREAKIAQLKAEIDRLSVELLKLDKEQAELNSKFLISINHAERAAASIEQYFRDDPHHSRPRFEEACKNLELLEKEDLYEFRIDRVPSLFKKKIADGISCVLGLPLEWKKQQVVLSDSAANARVGDELALRFNYNLKLAQMVKEFNVYDYVSLDEETFVQPLNLILADPRFRRDSYYIESLGPVAPPLVDFVKTANAYILAAKAQKKNLMEAEQMNVEASRLRALHAKKLDELAPIQGQITAHKRMIRELEEELIECRVALNKADDMLEFLKNTFEENERIFRSLDYYGKLEYRLMQEADKLQIEASLQGALIGVEERHMKEEENRKRLAIARGEPEEVINPPVERPQIKTWIKDVVLTAQEQWIAEGYSLGHNLPSDPEEYPLSPEDAQDTIKQCVSDVIDRMNGALHDNPWSVRWSTLKGKSFDTRFLYVLAWKVWESEAVEGVERRASEAWEEIFGGPDECARMAIESKVNMNMASLAKEQGAVWAKRHKADIAQMEQLMSDEFESYYPQETAATAILYTGEEKPPGTPSAEVAAANCWVRLHPEEVRELKDHQSKGIAKEFAKRFGKEASNVAFRVLNGLGNKEESTWYSNAEAWKTFNENNYDKAAGKLTMQMAAAFEKQYPQVPHMEAAKIILSKEIAGFMSVTDEQAKVEPSTPMYFNALSWGKQNRGRLTGARAQVLADHAVQAMKLWRELATATDDFKKGTFMMLTPEERADPKIDRFFVLRQRLEARFNWLYGYLCHHHSKVLKDIEDLNNNDPMGKILHNVRPSLMQSEAEKQEKEYRTRRAQLQTELNKVLDKLSTWNTYYGYGFEEPEEQAGEEGAY